MAKIDVTIAKLFEHSAEELVLQSGLAVFLRVGGETRVLVRRPLTTEQVMDVVDEIVPASAKVQLGSSGLAQFVYRAPGGEVTVRVERSNENTLKARVTPGALPDLEDLLPDATAVVASPAPRRAGPGPSSLAPQPSPGTAGPVRPPVTSGGAERSPAELMRDLLDLVVARKASDLHLTSKLSPAMRIDGDIVALDFPPIEARRLEEMIFSITPERNKEEWSRIKDTDFGYEIDSSRFRVNVFADRMGIGSVMRLIPNEIWSAEKMGLTKPILDLCFLTKGLVLVTGPTGSGKSTTLAAMVDYANRHRADHIITIEDPIEFVHPRKKCLVHQREVGTHTGSFKHALRAALREDPDVVLVGELRDLETVQIAIETAETGHLVFGTLHTNTAPSTVDRIIDQFPAGQQSQIRTMLSETLKAVISQTLCKKIGGGRVGVQEILICTAAVCNLIREGKTFQIAPMMQTGKTHGMQTLNDALLDLVKRRVVEPTEAYMKAVHKVEFKGLLDRNGFRVELPSD